MPKGQTEQEAPHKVCSISPVHRWKKIKLYFQDISHKNGHKSL